jgi:hypothetical protein
MANHSRGIPQGTKSVGKLLVWIDAHIIDLARQLRLSYLPPLLVLIAIPFF